MKFKTLVIWWLVTGQEHPLLTDNDRRIYTLAPLADALFPGINYYSTSGFYDVMHRFVTPALRKRCRHIQSMSAEQIADRPEAETDVAQVLSANGYDWQDSEWQEAFRHFLAA